MRNAFAKEITALAQTDSRVVLLSGDIGNRLFDAFKDACPDRFYNCGVAEANMIGVSAGMAMLGLRPVCYTITPFITYRCIEQIRVDLCYHKQPVIVVGTGSGLSYASLGATHHSCEEIAMLRALPDLVVMAPADAHEVRACLRLALTLDQPVYIRIGKKGEPLIHAAPPTLELGRAIAMQEGEDIVFISTGTMLSLAQETAQKLQAQGHASVKILSMPCIKPLDETALQTSFTTAKIVATFEEHSIIGGLGGAVAEWLADHPSHARLLRFGTPDSFLHHNADQDEARAHFGLTADALCERISQTLADVGK